MTEPTPPVPAPPPTREKTGLSPNLVMIVATLALGIAVATWLLNARRIDELRAELTDLQDAHRTLAQQMPGGRAPGGAVGRIVSVANAPALGPADALVAMIEFSDYECPFCIRHFQQTMPEIRREYIDTGKIRYIFRDFPIDQNHPQAIKAHEAAHCALEQKRFWDMHVRLFSAPGTHTPAQLEERAREAKLDEAAFRSCIASGRTTQGIRATAQGIESLGATGTPWFLIGVRDPQTDRVRVVKSIGGAQPFAQFAAAIEAAAIEARAN